MWTVRSGVVGRRRTTAAGVSGSPSWVRWCAATAGRSRWPARRSRCGCRCDDRDDQDTEVTDAIAVLVVEDDQVAAEAHRTYVDRVPGFRVAGVAHSGA